MRAYSSLSFVFLLLASSVVGAKDKSPPDPVTLPASLAGAPAESAGTVIGTLGYRTDNKPYVGSAALVFRRAGATDVGAIQYIRSTAKLQGDTQSLDDKKGEFHYATFSMALPEGQYELIGVVANARRRDDVPVAPFETTPEPDAASGTTDPQYAATGVDHEEEER